jgi:hypothetical protein
MPKKDLNQIAANIVALTTGAKVKEEAAKNPAAVALGRLGGLKGGKARAKSLSADQRREIAKAAATKRWGKQ